MSEYLLEGPTRLKRPSTGPDCFVFLPIIRDTKEVDFYLLALARNEVESLKQPKLIAKNAITNILTSVLRTHRCPPILRFSACDGKNGYACEGKRSSPGV